MRLIHVHTYDCMCSLTSPQTTVFSVLFLLCLGMILFGAGSFIIYQSTYGHAFYHPVNLAFAGALIATVSWVSACIVSLIVALLYNSDNYKIQRQKFGYNYLYCTVMKTCYSFSLL